jgi:hypothetical protein
LNLPPKILYAINVKIPSKAITPTSDRLPEVLAVAGTVGGACMIIVGGTFAWEVIGTTCDMVFFGARIQLPLES